MHDRFDFVKNEYSWNNNANVMYIDQPVGTGFSFTDFFSHRVFMSQVTRDFENFMVGFFQKYPEFVNRDIYLTGESYAGHYIPAIANHFFYWPMTGFNLAGIAIGDGWVDPFYQFASFGQYAAMNNLITVGHEYVVDILFQICQFFQVVHIPMLSTTICMLSQVTIATPGFPEFNIYDIREPCERFGLCYPDDHLWEVLDSYEYRTMMGLPVKDGTKWEMCDTVTHMFLTIGFDQNWGYALAPLLDKGVPVLIYTGDQDYIANWKGVGEWTDGLVWEGQNEFQFSQTKQWRTKADPHSTAGLVKQF
jgi:cathepsin A (carboxypeptidase C)